MYCGQGQQLRGWSAYATSQREWLVGQSWPYVIVSLTGDGWDSRHVTSEAVPVRVSESV